MSAVSDSDRTRNLRQMCNAIPSDCLGCQMFTIGSREETRRRKEKDEKKTTFEEFDPTWFWGVDEDGKRTERRVPL
ncbi:hypothetical protein L2E82_49861 [Cichorium intybus]|uniref:Uncharacterized protein n=1 Tax=Cichorium intybus TaxID=13427 RepID=A0ACB8Z0J4_CICIN|nr:hypothetical protein L2E82_49861 [Cichorium intybus]